MSSFQSWLPGLSCSPLSLTHACVSLFPPCTTVSLLTPFRVCQAIAACARDLVLATLLFSLAIGCTIACCLFTPGADPAVGRGIKAAAYFWLLAAALAWWRSTAYLIEEAFGPNHTVTKFFPIFRLPIEHKAPIYIPGLGEPGVKRGAPKMIRPPNRK